MNRILTIYMLTSIFAGFMVVFVGWLHPLMGLPETASMLIGCVISFMLSLGIIIYLLRRFG